MIKSNNHLTDFLESVDEAKKSLELLREVVKNETSRKISENIDSEKLLEANALIEELSEFLKIEFTSNCDLIEKHASSILNKDISFSKKAQPSEKKEVKIFNEEETEEFIDTKLTKNEIEVIKIIGENGFFDQRESDSLSNDVLHSLNKKGYLDLEEVFYNSKNNIQFELTNKGKRTFEQHFELQMPTSKKQDIIEKYHDLEHGLLLFNFEERLSNEGYTIHEISEERIELSLNNVNVYLTPIFEEISRVNIINNLNKLNQLKKIGFLTETTNELEEIKQIVDSWASQNPNKSKFLKVYFSSMDKFFEEKLFEIIKY